MQLSIFMNHIEQAVVQTGKPILDVLRFARGIGIEGIECEPCATDAEADALLALLDSAGMRVADVYTHLDFTQGLPDAEMLAVIRSVQRLNSPRMLVIPALLPVGADEQLAFRQTVTGLQRFCELAGAQGVLVMVEDFDHARSLCATQSKLEALFAQVPALWLAFDTGNFLFSGEEALDAFDVLKGRIRHVHCKDRTFDAGRGGVPQCVVDGKPMYPVAVGGGCIHMRELLQKLQTIGYEGYLSIEHFDSPDQLNDMRLSAAWLHKALA